MDKTYTSGQVSGMTDIPIRTIQDYVSAFRDCFSELARQPSKSRRFNDQDIKNLFTIKRARSQRYSDDEIRQIFSGEIILPLASEYNENDIKQMSINANERLSRAIELEGIIQKQVNSLSKMVWAMDGTVKTFKGDLDHLLAWQKHMKSYDKDFNPELIAYEKAMRELERKQKAEQPKPKSIFERWLAPEIPPQPAQKRPNEIDTD